MNAVAGRSSRKLVGRIGLIVIAAAFVAAVAASNGLLRGLRLDLTDNGLYTLSRGTHNILGDIDEPIDLYFFYSDSATGDMPYLRTYAERVRELLDEFAEESNGKLRVTEVDPLPFSEDEDRAAAFGLRSIRAGNTTEPLYIGIAGTNSVGDTEVIAFLDPSKESFLEYDLARLIDTLVTPQRPIIGLISSLPMQGGFDPQMRQPTPPWVVMNQAQNLFDVRRIESDADAIDPDIAVLMVVHPKSLSDALLYAIDQYVMHGGHALFVVDPYAEIDVPPQDPANPAAAMMASRSSNLNRLTSAWGVTTSTDQFVGDDRNALTVSTGGGRPLRHLGLIGISDDGIDADDIVTGGLESINLGYAGYITVADDAAASVAPLLQSSELAAPLPTTGLAFQRDPNMLRNNFEPTGQRYTLAARITGKVPSAFADGPPEGADKAQYLAASTQPINVVLIADADFLADRLWVQVQQLFGQQIATPFAGNGDFVFNALDNLTGSSDLISIRGRASYARPFTKVEALRRIADARFRETEERLQQQLRDTEARLAELQASREDSGTLLLSGEQAAELDRFEQQRLDIRKELRQVQRNLDQQIEDLGTRLKLINIGLMPLVITVFSIGILLVRRRRRAAAARRR